MNQTPLTVASWPRAILHLDGDAFFTSVEQALNPALRGKPLVTGKERGIIACASYEAKAFGIKRGLSLLDARKICPGLVVLPSDYESYGLYSKRMFDILRRYTPEVEEYSIDEAFADLTGMRRIFRCSYEDIARNIRKKIAEELGLTVSAGLSLSKSLAKLCSKFRKPDGFTAVEGRHIHLLLQRTPLETVWGFGPSATSLLGKLGLRTAWDFVVRPVDWADRLLGKPGREIWNELRGNCVWKVCREKKTTFATIMKSKTFTPPSDDRAYVYAKLVRNVESAFARARRYKLRPAALAVVLRRQDFSHDGLEARLNRPTASTLEALPLVKELFGRAFREKNLYRATMIVLGRLEDDTTQQRDLFEDHLKIEALRRVTEAVDAVNEQYGKHTLRSAVSLFLENRPPGEREAAPANRRLVMPGETARRRLAIPRWSLAV